MLSSAWRVDRCEIWQIVAVLSLKWHMMLVLAVYDMNLVKLLGRGAVDATKEVCNLSGLFSFGDFGA